MVNIKKGYSIDDVYLLHVERESFYIPTCDSECYFSCDTVMCKNYYVLALKKENGTFIDINSFKRFKGKENFGFGYIESINMIIPLKDVLNNENLLNDYKIKMVFDKIMIENSGMVLRMKKGYRR